MHQTKSNKNMQVQACGTCNTTKVNGVCPRGCKTQPKMPAWMAKTYRRMEHSNQ